MPIEFPDTVTCPNCGAPVACGIEALRAAAQALVTLIRSPYVWERIKVTRSSYIRSPYMLGQLEAKLVALEAALRDVE
jgi:hypothetical protein